MCADATKWQHMMLAGGVELDIAQKHHLVVLFGVKLGGEYIISPLIVAAE